MMTALALCLSLHTAGPVATLAQSVSVEASTQRHTITVAAKKPGTTKPKKGDGGRADPRKKPPIRVPDGRTRPGGGGGGVI